MKKRCLLDKCPIDKLLVDYRKCRYGIRLPYPVAFGLKEKCCPYYKGDLEFGDIECSNDK